MTIAPPATSPLSRRTVVVVSQTFVPDPASVGQHVADVAFELARRAHRVRVYASARGYENAALRYPRRETIAGTDVRRFPLASFGKKNLLLRVLGTAMFHLQAFFAALFTPRLAGIFFSTSPPLIGLPLCLVGILRRVPVVYWAMDLNPDQLIALGKLKSTSPTARVLEAANRFILRRAALVIALDRFMAARLIARRIDPAKILVLPPWPHEEHLAPAAAENPFRTQHQLNGRFVVMYSGNHSPSNPLITLLDAAVQLKDEPSLIFLFVGGGLAKRDVERYQRDHALTNVLSLPYQPLATLGDSLSAADVHVVSLGEAMVGIIHPCKIYGAMAVARPVLFLGPRPSHIADLLEQHPIGLHVSHGDVDGMVAALEQFRRMRPEQRHAMGSTAAAVLNGSISQSRLCGQFCDAVESALVLSRNLSRGSAAPVPSPGTPGEG